MTKYTLLFWILCVNQLQGQELKFSPELLSGHRSLSYAHLVKYSFCENITVDNLTLYDSEYTSDVNNFFFIRNSVSLKLIKGFSMNASIGLKNPGSFVSVLMNYQYSNDHLFLRFSVGSNYHLGFTLEQSLILNYSPEISPKISGYFNLFLLTEHNRREILRGIQQVRIGLKQKMIAYGIGANLDQFSNSTRALFNLGLFIKFNFSG